MLKEKKEKWDKPKLFILTRSKPEELVLTSCKAAFPSGGVNNTVNTACRWMNICNTCNNTPNS